MTRAGLLQAVRASLGEAGIETPALDARLIVQHGLGLDAAALITGADQPVTEAEAILVMGLARRRAAREPLARLTGEREFHSLRLRLGPETLVPRPDTETLVEAVLEALHGRDASPLILDLGTGSGAILLALLAALPEARGIGVDLAPGAVAVAHANAQALGLDARASFVVGQWGAALTGCFDVIVSNPPYIPHDDIDALEPEVRLHDPLLALDGGADGLDAYRAILGDAARLIAPGGLMALELGAGQAAAVTALAHAEGWSAAPPMTDLGGVERVLLLRR